MASTITRSKNTSKQASMEKNTLKNKYPRIYSNSPETIKHHINLNTKLLASDQLDAFPKIGDWIELDINKKVQGNWTTEDKPTRRNFNGPQRLTYRTREPSWSETTPTPLPFSQLVFSSISCLNLKEKKGGKSRFFVIYMKKNCSLAVEKHYLPTSLQSTSTMEEASFASFCGPT